VAADCLLAASGVDLAELSDRQAIDAKAGAILLSELIRDVRVIRQALTTPEK
jgi:hypothetical protein